MFSIDKINQQTEIVHRAIQIIVKASKSWLPEKADDSHTNLNWNIKSKSFESREFQFKVRLFLNLSSFELEIHQNEKIKKAVKLSGQKHQNIEGELNQSLQLLGFDKEIWNPKLHYDLPYSSLEEFSYPIFNSGYFQEFVEIRNFGQDLFLQFESKQNLNLELRTWPHHFDLGGQIIHNQDGNGETSCSLGLGLAMQDSLIPEYYLYLSHWAKGDENKSQNPPQIKIGEWNKDMSMYILRISDLNESANSNEEMANQFLSEAIDNSKNILNP